MSWSTALVIRAGVGRPSGVTGTTFIVLSIPKTRYSTSRVGVYKVSSGLAPATLISGIIEVSMDAIKTRIEQFYHQNQRSILAIDSEDQSSS
jgi:hypothetical protein